ncbi:MAG: tetratricopeptide repeat protein [Candidatus Paracaedibacter sp.]
MTRLLIFMVLCSFIQVSCNRLSTQDNEQDSLIRAGDRVQAAGDSSSAINVYKSALEKNPPHKLPLYLKLGEAYMNAERLDEAKKVYEEALPIDENDEVKKQLGRLYLSTNQPDTAISIFEGIILVHKDDIRALSGLGVAYDTKGDHQTAQSYYQKALQINEENNDVKSNMGLSLAFEGRYEDSLKLLQPIGEALGVTSKQRHNLALVYSLSGNHQKAQEIFAKDMTASDINENLHAIRMAPKRIYKPKPKPESEQEPVAEPMERDELSTEAESDSAQ